MKNHLTSILSVRSVILILLILATVSSKAFPFQPISNFASTITVSDFAFSGDTVFAASSGGLLIYNSRNNSQKLFRDPMSFPDLNLTALAFDSQRNLWIGTLQGYLYKRTPDGRQIVYTGYKSDKWAIRDIFVYNRYLILSADKGCSIFDTKTGNAVNNATGFGNFTNPEVNKALVYGDTLYLACTQGLATLPASQIVTGNFYDKSIWKTKTDSAGGFADLFVSNGSVIPVRSQVADFNGKYFFSFGTQLFTKSTPDADTANSRCVWIWSSKYQKSVTCIAKQDVNNLWVGTVDGYCYHIDNAGNVSQLVIQGPIASRVERLHVAKDGKLWVLPYTSNWLWNDGPSCFDGASWNVYSAATVTSKNYGWTGGGGANHGICELNDGSMWFGFWGGNVKAIDISRGWGQYYFGLGDGKQFTYINQKVNTFALFPELKWPDGTHLDSGCVPFGVCHAIAQDSSGFVWIGAYENNDGCLIAYDPRYLPDSTQSNPVDAHYKRFLPKGGPDFMGDIYSLHVDHNNRIFVGTNGGYLKGFTYESNPLTEPLTKFLDTSSLGGVLDFKEDINGKTWIVTRQGVFSIGLDEEHIVPVDELNNTDYTCIETVDGVKFWLGTTARGLVEWNSQTQKFTNVTKESGLLSNTINDIEIDGKNGRLWIATDLGISRYDIGSFDPLSSSTKVAVGPNPYSLRKNDRGISFSKIPADAIVNIYSPGGALVSKCTGVNLSDHESATTWTPSKKTTPGVYLYSVRPGGSHGKVLIVP